jgi:tetratricopeptide (TPR) repeat protein
MHLSRCPSCLAELAAAKTELAEIAAEETGHASPGIAVPIRRSGRMLRPAPLAASISIAAVLIVASTFLLLRLVRDGDHAIVKAQAAVSEIVAASDIGEMRLFGGPDRPVARSIVFRGAGAASGDRFDRIARSLKVMLDERRDDWRVYAALGDLYLAANQIERADNFYAQALDLSPENARLLNGRAVAAHRLGNFNAARVCLEKVLEVEGRNAIALYNLAVLHRSTGDQAAARSYVDAYLEKDPSSAWSERARALARE